ncbi:hypothetical protein CAC42_5017 [Sphaceloma murrayae]|uniref:Uncharacterized protein n=1 Tax=Sphaceloma murrayae TaxID=2082308 RepID=A0A2K1QQA0_9PEZI|nr:hypothetical protein CAC42_5017 [Sphaceloma murrayae]
MNKFSMIKLRNTLRKQDAKTVQHFTSNDNEACKAILRARALPLHEGDLINKLTDMEARAIPNHRLVNAFAIKNRFVVAEPGFCKAWKEQAKLHVQKDHNEWATARSGTAGPCPCSEIRCDR